MCGWTCVDVSLCRPHTPHTHTTHIHTHTQGTYTHTHIHTQGTHTHTHTWHTHTHTNTHTHTHTQGTLTNLEVPDQRCSGVILHKPVTTSVDQCSHGESPLPLTFSKREASSSPL
jgi:hypothetical protein